jgi:hypothetical protein
MAIANTTVRIRNSGVANNVPSSLAFGELALNYADGKLFYKAANGSIVQFFSSTGGGGASSNSFSTINVNSSLILATSPTDTLNLLAANGISVTSNTITKTITVDGAATQALAQAAFNAANNASSSGGVLTSTVNTFLGDGSNRYFNLTVTPADINYTTLVIGGVSQPRSYYTVVGSLLTTSSAPANNIIVEVTTVGSSNATLYTINYTTNNILSPFLLMGA